MGHVHLAQHKGHTREPSMFRGSARAFEVQQSLRAAAVRLKESVASRPVKSTPMVELSPIDDWITGL
jgi:hypothetical protein